MPTAVSLFSGCGGSDAGLRAAGFEVLLANDIAPYARDLYVANLPETDFRLCPVEEIRVFPAADLLVGCYPCQGFSVGGTRDPDNTMNFLYREFDRALRSIKPKAFIVENVSGMIRASHRHLLNNQITRFRLAGYRVWHNVLDAKDFGVAQERVRLFLVGIRSDIIETYEFPMKNIDTDRRKIRKIVTIQDAIGDLPEWPDKDEYDAQPFHWYYLSRNRWRDWNECARTIVANSRHVALHPISPPLVRVHTDSWKFKFDGPARRFSYRETSRLQGFRADLEFPDTAGVRAKYQVIGNAVPPPLFQAVAQSIPNIW